MPEALGILHQRSQGLELVLVDRAPIDRRREDGQHVGSGESMMRREAIRGQCSKSRVGQVVVEPLGGN